MTELQQVELELLKIYIGICEKWDLEYFLVCGSALGAAKYHGFIPWDDDIDVAMPRTHYEKFLEVASKEIPDWCFLQNYKTDPAFPHIYSKLRNSSTTFIEAGTSDLPINHGIYIDIFPLDGYPENKISKGLFDLRKKVFTWKQYCALKDDPRLKVRIRNRFFRVLGYHRHMNRTLTKLDRFYRSYPAEVSSVWCNHGNWQRKLEYAPRWHYGKGCIGYFEGVEVRLPEKYDDYLSQKYGDWRADLPEEKKKSHHSCIICDVNTPYTRYRLHDEQ